MRPQRHRGDPGGDAAARLAELAYAGCRFAGITSYLDFPNLRDVRDYGELCEAWLHCFREPDRYLPPGTPRALISESDFTDPRLVDPSRLTTGTLRADVVYVCGHDPWRAGVKNWPLARRCVPELIAAGRSVLLVDPPPGEPCAGALTTGPLPWPELLRVLGQSRALLLPGVAEPSPRLLAEALCLDVPVVVNRRILGGWKYVNPFTGAFFDTEHDVAAAVRGVLGRRPRRWFAAHHGPARAGAALLAVLRGLDPELPNVTHVRITSDDAVGAPPEPAKR